MRINVHNQGTHSDGLVERTSYVFQVNLRGAAECGMGDRREADAPCIVAYRVTTRMSVAIGNGCCLACEVHRSGRSPRV
jgi:hypothetical protein